MIRSATAGIGAMVWTPILTGTAMFLTISVDGRSYNFKSSAAATVEDGRRFVVGSITRTRATDAGVNAHVVDVVTVDESSALVGQYPSRGRFRVLRRCASLVSSFATYAVLETASGSILVVR